MAQAAYCDKCGANVFVTEDGRCPNGHGPESLSKYYEAEEQPPVAPPADTPAEDAPPAAAVPPAVVPPAVVPPAAVPPASTPPSTTPPATVPPGGGIPVSPPPAESISPAATAYAAATPGGPAPKKKSKLGLIIGIVLAVLLLCGVGVGVATCALVDAAEDATGEFEAALDEAAAEIEAELENELGAADDPVEEEPASQGIELEMEAMVKYFYPGFTMIDYAETDTVDGATSYHILTQSEDSADFYMTFFAERDPNGDASDPATQFDDERAGIVWNHPETVSHGLRELAGPGTLDFTDIMDYFGAEHSDLNVTEFGMNSNVMVTFRGIHDDDLDAWYDDFITFESVWESNLAEGTWEETSFTTFEAE